ncbi:translation initiation factor IF-2-like, partial [Penaeus monodon]|uniref:translation initiation factor IF-2-like n=1 Tax=Penaeus monodon TaxID=6687 RepID=UPI0018A6E0D7
HWGFLKGPPKGGPLYPNAKLLTVDPGNSRPLSLGERAFVTQKSLWPPQTSGKEKGHVVTMPPSQLSAQKGAHTPSLARVAQRAQTRACCPVLANTPETVFGPCGRALPTIKGPPPDHAGSNGNPYPSGGPGNQRTGGFGPFFQNFRLYHPLAFKICLDGDKPLPPSPLQPPVGSLPGPLGRGQGPRGLVKGPWATGWAFRKASKPQGLAQRHLQAPKGGAPIKPGPPGGLGPPKPGFSNPRQGWFRGDPPLLKAPTGFRAQSCGGPGGFLPRPPGSPKERPKRSLLACSPAPPLTALQLPQDHARPSPLKGLDTTVNHRCEVMMWTTITVVLTSGGRLLALICTSIKVSGTAGMGTGYMFAMDDLVKV